MLGNIFEQVHEPDLADKSSYADQQEVPIRKVLSHREAFDPRTFPEKRDGPARRNCWTGRRLHRALKLLGLLGPAQPAQKLFARGSGRLRCRWRSTPRARAGARSDRSSVPVALPSRNSRRFEMIDATPKWLRQRRSTFSSELPYKDDALAVADSFD